ncbi:hypothetical protein SAMN02910263_02579 [Butyrivibrio sp. INlla16]|nr:hypothetical protein SAMN02910263_02579 [Butyrivibrio sp. INlla16]
MSTPLTRHEQETIINFNAGEQTATIYTADKAVMRKIDALVADFPSIYRILSETTYAKTYEVPKKYISYRKPRRLTEEQREQARNRIKILNNATTNFNNILDGLH